ncbi:hypothetical protein ACCO45_003544 [Purpureocillium lilacinum]|uniref:Uncharacterized protein n=1 Tax=Purpureocillium lilacinum TaxID=33203 RepID=A0ACC4E2Y7_PURLI
MGTLGTWPLAAGGLGREEICRCNAAPSPVPTPSRCFHDEDWRIWGLEESQLLAIDQPSRADQPGVKDVTPQRAVNGAHGLASPRSASAAPFLPLPSSPPNAGHPPTNLSRRRASSRQTPFSLGRDRTVPSSKPSLAPIGAVAPGEMEGQRVADGVRGTTWKRGVAQHAWHGMVITECHLVTSTPSGQISGHARPAPWLAAQMGEAYQGHVHWQPGGRGACRWQQHASLLAPPSSGLTDLATLPRLSLQLPKLPQTVRVCQRSHLGQRPQRLLTARPDGRRWSGRGETRRSAKQGPNKETPRIPDQQIGPKVRPRSLCPPRRPGDPTDRGPPQAAPTSLVLSWACLVPMEVAKLSAQHPGLVSGRWESVLQSPQAGGPGLATSHPSDCPIAIDGFVDIVVVAVHAEPGRRRRRREPRESLAVSEASRSPCTYPPARPHASNLTRRLRPLNAAAPSS